MGLQRALKLLACLSLACFATELADPSTPFVRVGDPAAVATSIHELDSAMQVAVPAITFARTAQPIRQCLPGFQVRRDFELATEPTRPDRLRLRVPRPHSSHSPRFLRPPRLASAGSDDDHLS